MAWLVSLPGGQALSNRLYRQMDDSATSVILNIAKGDGRYSELDHRRFLDIAKGSGRPGGCYLDLAVQRFMLPQEEGALEQALLERIMAMLSRM